MLELVLMAVVLGAGNDVPNVRIEAESIPWNPSPHWIPNPSATHALAATDAGVRFAAEQGAASSEEPGAIHAMRWTGKLAEPFEMADLPYVAVRYRAKGQFAQHGYVFWIGVRDDDGKTRSTYPMQPGHVVADGRWHTFRQKLGEKGETRGMAVGIDARGPSAEIEIDYVEFSPRFPMVPISELLDFTPRGESWPAGQRGFTTVPLPAAHAACAAKLCEAMGLGAWFATPRIEVEGVPFLAPEQMDGVPASTTEGEEQLAVPVGGEANELLLLLAADYPHTERFDHWKALRPLPWLDEPERMTVELIYADGTSDHMLPVHVAGERYGVNRGLAMYALRPSLGKTIERLVLHDRMRNAAFGIAGVTINTGEPRFAEPAMPSVWYPPIRKPERAPADVRFNTSEGLAWQAIRSPVVGGAIELAGRPVFKLVVGEAELPSTQWQVVRVREEAEQFLAVAEYRKEGLSLRAELLATRTEIDEVELSLDVKNLADEPVTGKLFFPCLDDVAIGSAADTWYFCGRTCGVIQREPGAWRDVIGEDHPLQVDGFFNPAVGGGLCLLPRDRSGRYRWYCVGKSDTGGHYALEFLPETVQPQASWSCVPVAVAVEPGDWRDQFHRYTRWLNTWHKPVAPRKEWFRNIFAFPTYFPAGGDLSRLDLQAYVQQVKEALGACDYIHLYGWAITPEYGHWGEYDHFHQYGKEGGKERFIQAVRDCQAQGTRVGMYLDGYLVSTKAQKPTPQQRERWGIRDRDGEMIYHKSWDAHSMCPYGAEWREHLTGIYRRLASEVQPNGMYVDEFGRNPDHRTCYSTEHGHPTPMGMSPGEGNLAREIRETVPPEIATYCEFVPSDVDAQYYDGAFSYLAMFSYRAGLGRFAPHYINLHRFAMPGFKQFELTYSAPLENGNWFLLKVPFFNGTGFYLKGSCLQSDEHSRAFYRGAFRVQHAHADAFLSEDVEPLVPTETRDLYANRFRTDTECVWTLYNAAYRTQRGVLLVVDHRDGTEYVDAWNERPVSVDVVDGKARLQFDIGPRGVGCIVQREQ